ncbi:MAG: triose-phosphate isomerase [Anaerolineaceae bacterium]|nr:triose-phosphate isomerase [Anaerolineaceae bacterium]
MKTKIRAPFFETSVKNYIYGDAVLAYAKAADAAAKEFDIDVIFVAPYTDIRRICENTDRLIVFAPYMDAIRPGRGIADVLPEALKAAGAKGVVLNHSERPMTLNALKKTIDRANELDLISFVCADSTAEAEAIAHLHPDILNPEPAELIGSGKVSDMGFVKEVIRAVKAIAPNIYVEQAAGITTAQQVYDFILAGSQAAGAASGILKSSDPYRLLNEMVGAVRKAKDALAA